MTLNQIFARLKMNLEQHVTGIEFHLLTTAWKTLSFLKMEF